MLIRSQPIVLDFDAFPAPTSPLPIPTLPLSSLGTSSRTPLSKPSTPMASPVSGSLKPPPRPRSVISHLALSKPPSESLPPVPSILHSNDSLYASSTPTTPTTPSFCPSSSRRQDSSLSTSLPSSSIRASGISHFNPPKIKTPRKFSNASGTQMEAQRIRLVPSSPARNIEEPVGNGIAPKREANKEERETYAYTDLPSRPVGLVATRFYGIESSMRWREGVDPIQKRFASSNGSWRCQDRFAIFFRPGDQIGPDQVVTKTFWSEAWPYPIETILYGTTDIFAPLGEPERGCTADEQEGHRSDSEGDRLSSKLRTSLRLTSTQTHLKGAASFPPAARHRDPRYITSEGVQKIAKVTIPMPDVAIDQMELVKTPIKVELRIFILEAPLRVRASAFLLGRTVAGTTELFL
ncbi:hypothetical protein BGZ65_012244 [Modicella reniformis]|uniref:Uncharacterized protein n=1 Tax=Modicella reniformis TaxID=1440133 RepID=A0A9P6J6H3_9FUNG|nr:hypothetical protein BGZ65_012244 [Modicella reniformis]